MMDLKSKGVGGVTVVEVHGKLLGGPDNTEKFHKFFGSLFDEGKQKIVVNLNDTPWADSQGVALVMGALEKAKAAGGDLVLAHANDRISNILTVMKLPLVLKTYSSEEEAVNSLA